MKNIFFTFALLVFAGSVFAGDLTGTVTNATIGTSTGSIDLTVTGGIAPFTFAWTGPSSFTASTEDIFSLPAGTYVVTVTDNFCGVATTSFVVAEDTATGLNPAAGFSSMKIFPNPFQNEIHLSFFSEVNEEAVVRLTDMLGRTVAEMNLNIHSAQNEHTLVVTQPIANGRYNLLITGKNGVIARYEMIHFGEK